MRPAPLRFSSSPKTDPYAPRSHLYRKYGSDRFLRIKLDDKCSRGGAPFGGDSRAAKLAQSLKDFLGHPLRIFGRQYRPFCAKDGAIVYWCESGHGLTTVPLVTFAERYIESSLNSDMSVAKWVARFELGRTTTIPTVTFARSQVLRTPDLLNDSLTISLSAMVQICALFQGDSQSDEYLPEGYVPSASCLFGHLIRCLAPKLTRSSMLQAPFAGATGRQEPRANESIWSGASTARRLVPSTPLRSKLVLSAPTAASLPPSRSRSR